MADRQDPIEVVLHDARSLPGRMEAWRTSPAWETQRWLSYDPAWTLALQSGLRQEPFGLEALSDGQTVGILPLMLVRSRLFGRFLVSMPYLNYGGVQATENEAAAALIDRAVRLANEFDVRHLELRHQREWTHPALTETRTDKVHMRRELPKSSETLWSELSPKVRNLVRKSQQQSLRVAWGGSELVADFFDVFSHNMRDLGTPTFGRELFNSILSCFDQQAELCVVYADRTAVAGALLLHGCGVTEVPSASSLRKHHATNANMLMYWHLLCRAIERAQTVFDFGRSSLESGTFRFKKQWGAQPFPAVWQYYVRHGHPGAMRPESRKFRTLVRLWQRMPLGLSRWLGPKIVRGIP